MVLGELLGAGKISPAIDRTYPLGEVPAAVRYMQEGNARGKVAITVSGTSATISPGPAFATTTVVL